MADVRQLQSDAELREQAGDWIVFLNMGDVSAEDRVRFEAWRRAHPRNEKAYNEVLQTWSELKDMGTMVRAYDMGQTLTESTQRAIRRSRAARQRGRRIAFASAAAMGMALCVGWWANMRSPDTLFQTGIGERATIKLPDGSALELNSDSLARVDYSGQSRVVRLERGEAYFEVEHDPQRPFWVAAGKSWVGAVGTAFNVNLRSAGVRVTVSEGSVKVAASTDKQPLDADLERTSVSLVKAGQQVNVEGAATEVRFLGSAQLNRSLSWRQGALDFKDDRLADVVEELNRYTPLKIVLEGGKLQGLQIGGTFETNPQGADALLSNLQVGFGLKVHREGRTVYVSEQ